MDLAVNLLKTCYFMYNRMPTGLAPEIAHFNMDSKNTEDIIVKVHSVDMLTSFDASKNIHFRCTKFVQIEAQASISLCSLLTQPLFEPMPALLLKPNLYLSPTSI